ncbi:MAG: ATPase, partial [Nitrosopumilus sp.]|nr:ATPase [Nitrosopumilus sp.]
MSTKQTSTFTDSALSDKVKEFLTRFKDKNGVYKYVVAIDEMMPKNAKYIIVDYNDLVVEPQIEVIFSSNPDRIFDAFSRAIKEALQTRFPDYAEKIKDEVRVRLINFPLERSLRQINAETIG